MPNLPINAAPAYMVYMLCPPFYAALAHKSCTYRDSPVYMHKYQPENIAPAYISPAYVTNKVLSEHFPWVPNISFYMMRCMYALPTMHAAYIVMLDKQCIF